MITMSPYHHMQPSLGAKPLVSRTEPKSSQAKPSEGLNGSEPRAALDQLEVVSPCSSLYHYLPLSIFSSRWTDSSQFLQAVI